MPPRNQRFNVKKKKKHLRTPGTHSSSRTEQPVAEIKPRAVYGTAFVVLEDKAKNTFVYNGTNWVPHSMTMAECRLSCQVKELTQKLGDKNRYEVREPI